MDLTTLQRTHGLEICLELAWIEILVEESALQMTDRWRETAWLEETECLSALIVGQTGPPQASVMDVTQAVAVEAWTHQIEWTEKQVEGELQKDQDAQVIETVVAAEIALKNAERLMCPGVHGLLVDNLQPLGDQAVVETVAVHEEMERIVMVEAVQA